MSTQTPLAERTRIVLAGLRNSGKSALLNYLFQREEAIVSEVAGTTTDPVTRSFELTGYGPVAFTDTAGLEDEGEIGRLREDKSLQRIRSADVILLVTRRDQPFSERERLLLKEFSDRPLLVITSFGDSRENPEKIGELSGFNPVTVSSLQKTGREEILTRLIALCNTLEKEPTPVEGLVKEGDLVLLVTPIDLAAPKGRLILPQVETIRDLLDKDCGALMVKERELRDFYHRLKEPPALVITDSQAFHSVAADIPEEQPLTSFSILFARKKGDLAAFVRGTQALRNPPKGKTIMILEACSHHRQADDIGTVKIPRLYRELIDKDAQFIFRKEITENYILENIGAVVMCGGCMVHKRVMTERLIDLEKKGIPVLNYGLFLAWINGLLPRALEPFPREYELYLELERETRRFK